MSKKNRDQEIKRLRRQIEALRAQQKLQTTPKRQGASSVPTSTKPLPSTSISPDERWLETYVRKGLRKTAIITTILLAIIVGLYFSGLV